MMVTRSAIRSLESSRMTAIGRFRSWFSRVITMYSASSLNRAGHSSIRRGSSTMRMYWVSRSIAAWRRSAVSTELVSMWRKSQQPSIGLIEMADRSFIHVAVRREPLGRTFQHDIFAPRGGAKLHALQRGRIFQRDRSGGSEHLGPLAHAMPERLLSVGRPPEEGELNLRPVQIERNHVAQLDGVEVIGDDAGRKHHHHVVVGGRLRARVKQAHVAQRRRELIDRR